MSIAIPLYLAITVAEISRSTAVPERSAYMSCHFSSYTSGLSNLPDRETEMLILDDSQPPSGHDPQVICRELNQLCSVWNVRHLLLDLQRPDDPETAQIVKAILDNKPCNTIVSQHYADGFDCPVFVSAPLPHQDLCTFLAPWANRQTWLELAIETVRYTVTETDCTVQPTAYEAAEKNCPELHCHYDWTVREDHIDFILSRDRQDCFSMLEEAERLGVSGAVGLYQQFQSFV